eukprot:SAG22_NODE_626_length_8433_cov_43.291097_1_plen_134_part_00
MKSGDIIWFPLVVSLLSGAEKPLATITTHSHLSERPEEAVRLPAAARCRRLAPSGRRSTYSRGAAGAAWRPCRLYYNIYCSGSDPPRPAARFSVDPGGSRWARFPVAARPPSLPPRLAAGGLYVALAVLGWRQ